MTEGEVCRNCRYVLDMTGNGAYTASGRWVQAEKGGVLLNGHGMALEPGQEPVWLTVYKGQNEHNSQGEPWVPAIDWSKE